MNLLISRKDPRESQTRCSGLVRTILWTTLGRTHPSTSHFIRFLSLKRFSIGSSSKPWDSSMVTRRPLILWATDFLLLPLSTPGASAGRTPGTGTSVGGLLEEVWGAGGSASEGTSTAKAVWAGAAELVSSVLAFFADPEAAVPFLLWALRPLASIRAASTSIPKKKKIKNH